MPSPPRSNVLESAADRIAIEATLEDSHSHPHRGSSNRQVAASNGTGRRRKKQYVPMLKWENIEIRMEYTCFLIKIFLCMCFLFQIRRFHYLGERLSRRKTADRCKHICMLLCQKDRLYVCSLLVSWWDSHHDRRTLLAVLHLCYWWVGWTMCLLIIPGIFTDCRRLFPS